MSRSPTTHQRYVELLAGSWSDAAFYRQLAMLVQADRYYLPAYLEHYWYALCMGNSGLADSIARQAMQVMKALLQDAVAQRHINETWTNLEMTCLHDLTRELRLQAGWFERQQLRVLVAALQRVVQPQQTASTVAPESGTNVRLMGSIECERLLLELQGLNPVWWNIDVARAGIVHHQHTESIIMRWPAVRTAEQAGVRPYCPVDGVHESYPEPMVVKQLPQLHRAVIDFAEQHNLGLGRVAVVKMSPCHQAYRHHDGVAYFQGRRRYHMVLQAGAQNILSSGTETVTAKPGEVWFFENKIMHRAENRSPVERIHVILDGYVLPVSEHV